ncbi:hypothetical protein [Aquibium oceanicum]|uniref:Uncharacterized protein n=1 Tax=Aquibium oceanicum TaxID=1670800 RepID=A0A1L3SWN4_9HYPH|nr:hypothetical protein [Aquibium oceanicum]APH73829.1 hypothetical protein BSQ44_22430 [Aquibium oceanicum]
MTRKLLTAAAIVAMTAGSAFAQTTSATGSKNNPYASTDEQMWYQGENRARYEGFFADPDMMELRSEDEITSAFDAMGQEDRDSIIAQCERAYDLRGSYGTVTTGLCNAVGVERPTGG